MPARHDRRRPRTGDSGTPPRPRRPSRSKALPTPARPPSCPFFFWSIRRPPRSTRVRSSAASDVYKRQEKIAGEIEAPEAGVLRRQVAAGGDLSLIHISEPTRLLSISYAVFCLKKKK